jgi:large exoprotein involved in heme utilization and adhesion
MKNSINQRDINGLASHFTIDARIVIDVPDYLGSDVNIGIDEYKDMLTKGWSASDKYSFRAQDLKIKIASNKKSAIVTSTVIETVQIDQKTASSSSTEEFSVILSGGLPLIKRLTAKLELPDDL